VCSGILLVCLMKLKGAVVAAIISLGLCVGAWATPWYQLTYTVGSKTSVQTFYWTHYIESSGGDSSTTDYLPSSGTRYPHIAAIFSNILAFLTAGAALLLATVVLQGLRAYCKLGKGSKVIKIIGQLIVFAALVLLGVAFFSFLGITKAFLNDQWSVCYLGSSSGYNNYNCATLMGTYSNTFILVNYSFDWKPAIGWWLCLAALVVSGFTVGGVFASKRK